MKHYLHLILFALPLSIIPAAATPVLIQNASFENATLPLNLGNGIFSNLVPGTVPTGGTLANWTPLNPTVGNIIGAFNPDLNYPNWNYSWENGFNVGLVQALGSGAVNAGLSQILSEVLQPNTTYTLGSLIGRRIFTRPTWNASIGLYANNQLLGPVTNTTLGANSVTGESFSVAIGASHAQLGQQLEIRLMTNGNGSEAFFDQVSLDASGVPEPGTWVLLTAGLSFIALRMKRNG